MDRCFPVSSMCSGFLPQTKNNATNATRMIGAAVVPIPSPVLEKREVGATGTNR